MFSFTMLLECYLHSNSKITYLCYCNVRLSPSLKIPKVPINGSWNRSTYSVDFQNKARDSI